MKPDQASRSSRYNLDFSGFESQLDAICQKAEDRLLELLSDDRLQVYIHTPAADASKNRLETNPLHKNESSWRQTQAQPSLVPFELRLGSLRIPMSKLSALEINEILPLTNSQKGIVQIWSHEKLCGAGALMVADGKLAVKIDWFDADVVTK